MSQPPGRSREPADKRADLVWSALFLVASVLGGLAAAKVTGKSGYLAVGMSVLVAAAMIVALYLGLIDRTDEPGGHVAGSGGHLSTENPGAYIPRATVPRADARPDQRPAPDQPVQPGVVQLVQQPSGGQAWWAG